MPSQGVQFTNSQPLKGQTDSSFEKEKNDTKREKRSKTILTLGKIDPLKQVQNVQVETNKKGRFTFLVEPENSSQYYCPFSLLNSAGNNTLMLVAKQAGKCVVTILKWNSDLQKPYPVASTEVIFDFCKKIICLPKFYYKEAGEIISPKNGILPIGKRVVFKVEFKGMLRVFARIDKGDFFEKIELFKKGNFFERDIIVPDQKIQLIGEVESTLKFEIMAEFDIIEDKDGEKFKNISEYWIEYSEKNDPFEAKFIPQNISSSHNQDLLEQIEQIFSSSITLEFIQGSKNVQNIEELAKKIKECSDKKLIQIALSYLWTTTYIIYDDDYIPELCAQDPETIMKSRKAICRGFANFFRQLMIKMDTFCRTVDGFVHTSNQVPKAANHTWNILKFEKYFYLLDCSNAALRSHAKISEENFAKNTRNFFFSNPKELLRSHLPEESCYALRPNYRFSYSDFKISQISSQSI